MENAELSKKNILEAIAKRIRSIRKEQGLSMAALAEQAGFTKSYMSQIENMKREPTIGTLVSIAHALGVDVFKIIGSEQPDAQDDMISIVKKRDRLEVAIPNVSSDTTFEAINYRKNDRLLDAYILTSSFEYVETPKSHEGQELLYVLEGKQEFLFNGKTYILEKGDCAYFDAQGPHYGRSLGKKKSKALVVYTSSDKQLK